MESCRWLLAYQATRMDSSRQGAVFDAARWGHLDVCKLLLETAEVNFSQGSYDEPWEIVRGACRHGCQELISLLLANGAHWDPEAPVYAAKHGHWALAEWLLQLHREDPSARLVCYTRLLEGAASGCDLPALKQVHALLLVSPPPPQEHVGPVRARSYLS